MSSFVSKSLAVSVVLLLATGCGERITARFPKIQVIDAEGNALTLLDFGKVQLNLTSTRSVRIRNAGSSSLTIDLMTFSDPHFTAGMAAPVVIESGAEAMVPFVFGPNVADQRVTGTLSIHSDDPDAPIVDVTLAGTGVAATAVAQPQAFEFGEVYVGENKAITFTLTNTGSNELPVTSAVLTMVDASVSGDLTPLRKTLAGGETATVTLTFAPTQALVLLGELTITLPAGIGDLHIPIRGSGIQARPQLCFRFDDTGGEACTDGTSSLDVRFGSLCDARVYPEDGGLTCTLDGGAIPYARSGKLYVRNDGNTPISFSMGFNAGQTNRCDGGSTIDFDYSNAPLTADGGTPSTWMVATAKLPNDVADPRPWETARIGVTYHPRSACRGGDDSDLSTVTWTRQNEPSGTMRRPSSLISTISGNSLLSNPQPNTVTFVGGSPLPQDVTLVSNTGNGPVRLLSADLFQSSDGGSVADVPCAGATSGPCTYFTWVDGPHLPATLEGTVMQGGRVTQVIGRLAYGNLNDAGVYVPPSAEQRLFVKVGTSDPYTPSVTVQVIGRSM